MQQPLCWTSCSSFINVFDMGLCQRKMLLSDTKTGLLLLSYRCLLFINVLLLLLMVQWVGLQCVILIFSVHTHLLFSYKRLFKNRIIPLLK